MIKKITNEAAKTFSISKCRIDMISTVLIWPMHLTKFWCTKPKIAGTVFVIFIKGVFKIRLGLVKKMCPCPRLHKRPNFEREKHNIFVNLKAQIYFSFIIHSEYHCLVCQAMILPIYLTCPSSPAHGE